jgi:hypothetical protein
MDNEDLIDLFAGMALQGLLSVGGNYPVATYVKDAYDLAEAMVEEKEKRLERKKVRSAQGN